MPRFPHRLLALTLCAALTFTACSDDPEDPASADDTVPSTTTTAAETTTTSEAAAITTEPALTVEQEVEAAYTEAFEAYFQAGTRPTEPSDLPNFFADAALAAAEDSIRRLAQDGLQSDYPIGLPDIAVDEVTATSTESASLRGCVVDRGRKLRVSDGSILDEQPASTLVAARLERLEGAWKIVAHRSDQEWPNDGGCAQ